MSQQSDMADAVYGRLNTAPVPVAYLVRELRSRWGAEHEFGEVHSFVRELIYCLSDHDDVEVGEMRVRKFFPWNIEPEDAFDKIDSELMEMDVFLEDEDKYVFRKRLAT